MSVPRGAAPLLLTIAAGLVCYGLFFNRGLGLSVIGYSVAPAERVMQGEVPYRDFLFNYTPGILWVNAALMKAFGATLMTTRLGLFVFKMLTLLMLFHVARKLTSAWAALLPVALALAWVGYQQIFNVYPDQYLMLFALGGLSCMLSYNETGRTRWLLFCGLAVGVVFIFKYNVGVLLLAFCALATAMRELMTSRRLGRATRPVAVFVTGFAIPAAGLIAYLICNHALGPMVSHFWHHASEYSESRSVSLPSPDLGLPAAMVLLPLVGIGLLVLMAAGKAFEVYWIAALVFVSIIMLQSYRGKVFNTGMLALVAYFPQVIFAAALMLAIWQVKKNKSDGASWWIDKGPLAITGVFALAVYLEVFPRADYHHLVRVLPPVFLFFMAILFRWQPVLANQLKSKVPSPRRVALLLASTPLIFLIAAGAKNTWEPAFDSDFRLRDNQQLAIERAQGILVEKTQAELTTGLVRLIQDNSSPDDSIFSFAQRGSAFYFLAARKNPTRFLWWRSVGISGEERDGVMAMIASRQAKLIIVQDIAANKEIQDFISANYEHVGSVADIAVYGLRRPASDAASDKLNVN